MQISSERVSSKITEAFFILFNLFFQRRSAIPPSLLSRSPADRERQRSKGTKWKLFSPWLRRRSLPCPMDALKETLLRSDFDRVRLHPKYKVRRVAAWSGRLGINLYTDPRQQIRDGEHQTKVSRWCGFLPLMVASLLEARKGIKRAPKKLRKLHLSLNHRRTRCLIPSRRETDTHKSVGS